MLIDSFLPSRQVVVVTGRPALSLFDANTRVCSTLVRNSSCTVRTARNTGSSTRDQGRLAGTGNSGFDLFLFIAASILLSPFLAFFFFLFWLRCASRARISHTRLGPRGCTFGGLATSFKSFSYRQARKTALVVVVGGIVLHSTASNHLWYDHHAQSWHWNYPKIQD